MSGPMGLLINVRTRGLRNAKRRFGLADYQSDRTLSDAPRVALPSRSHHGYWMATRTGRRDGQRVGNGTTQSQSNADSNRLTSRRCVSVRNTRHLLTPQRQSRFSVVNIFRTEVLTMFSTRRGDTAHCFQTSHGLRRLKRRWALNTER